MHLSSFCPFRGGLGTPIGAPSGIKMSNGASFRRFAAPDHISYISDSKLPFRGDVDLAAQGRGVWAAKSILPFNSFFGATRTPALTIWGCSGAPFGIRASLGKCFRRTFVQACLSQGIVHMSRIKCLTNSKRRSREDSAYQCPFREGCTLYALRPRLSQGIGSGSSFSKDCKHVWGR